MESHYQAAVLATPLFSSLTFAELSITHTPWFLVSLAQTDESITRETPAVFNPRWLVHVRVCHSSKGWIMQWPPSAVPLQLHTVFCFGRGENKTKTTRQGRGGEFTFAPNNVTREWLPNTPVYLPCCCISGFNPNSINILYSPGNQPKVGDE